MSGTNRKRAVVNHYLVSLNDFRRGVIGTESEISICKQIKTADTHS